MTMAKQKTQNFKKFIV